MNKNIQHNTVIDEVTKESSTKKKEKKLLKEEYLCSFSWKMQPVTDGFLERFATDLVEWALNDKNALTITDFYNKKGINRQTYYNWIKKYPIVAEAHSRAMDSLAVRREVGAIKKKYDSNAILRSMGMYSPEWQQMKENDFKMKQALKENESKNETKIVIMERFDSSPLVPEKIK